jgi:hypothetical protein
MAVSALIGAGDDYKQKYGFFDPERYVFKAKRGLNEEIVREISLDEGRARVDDGDAPALVPDLRMQGHAHVGRRPLGHRLREHLLLPLGRLMGSNYRAWMELGSPAHEGGVV